MIQKMFAVYDLKAKFFGQPFFEAEQASAIRCFSDAVNDSSNPSNMWNKHPGDFQLYEIGEYNTETGEVTPSLTSALVMANALIRRKPTDDLPLFEVENNKTKTPVK